MELPGCCCLVLACGAQGHIAWIRFIAESDLWALIKVATNFRCEVL